MDDFYGKLVGKYTSPMDAVGITGFVKFLNQQQHNTLQLKWEMDETGVVM